MARNPYSPPAAALEDADTAGGEGFRDLSGLTGWLSFLLVLGVAVYIAQLSASPLGQIGGGRTLLLAAALVLVLAQELLFIVTVILFLRWIYHAHSNVRVLGARGLTYSPGWAVGAYFIPIVNLWVPLRAMIHLARASRAPATWERERTAPVIVTWWVVWLLWWAVWLVAASATIAVQVLIYEGGQMLLPPVRLQQEAAILSTMVGILAVPQYLLARLVVRRIWRYQARQHARPAAVA